MEKRLGSFGSWARLHGHELRVRSAPGQAGDDLADPALEELGIGLAHVALRLRVGGGLGRGRPIASVLLLGMLPVAREVPALAALGIVAAVCASLIGYEAIGHREGRAWDPRPAGGVHDGGGLACRNEPEGPPSSKEGP
ncbi:MAG: hypothetical protein QOH66_2946 [Actinomycetota bacterium]|nr:hypothetical protein [Actinomycetota bacterium]